MKSALRRVGLVAVSLLLVPAGIAQEPPVPPQPPQPAKPVDPVKPAVLIAPPVPARQQTQQELKQKRTDKLQKPVFQNAAWRLDYDAAREEARKDGKLLLVYFTRSYAG